MTTELQLELGERDVGPEWAAFGRFQIPLTDPRPEFSLGQHDYVFDHLTMRAIETGDLWQAQPFPYALAFSKQQRLVHGQVCEILHKSVGPANLNRFDFF